MKKIFFYRQDNLHGYFSNFWPAPIGLEGKIWPTSEHYYQAQKFHDPEMQEYIRISSSPSDSAQRGRDRAFPLRPDWEEVKDGVMYRALEAKFTQHPDLREKLLETQEAFLVEHTRNDAYWADGGDGSGQNKLGYLLMRLRDALRNGES